MASEVRNLDLILRLKDQASKELQGFNGKLKSVEPAFEKMAVAGTAAFAGIASGVGLAIKEASRFEKSMGNVATLIDTNVEDMELMKERVLNLSKELPVPIEELSTALYDIRSAGIDANQAMLTLNWSAKLASAGLSTTKEATDILTSALNSFKEEGLDAKETSDILFKTVKAGKTTISELAISFGASAPVIAEAGIKLADFQAATAALTTTGLPASQAQMGLRQAIVALIKPTTDMEALFESIGVKSGRELINTSDNMQDVFKKLKKASDDNNISFEKAVGSVEALNATTGLLGSTGEAYINTLNSMQNGTTEIDEAFKKQSETFTAQMQMAKNQFSSLSILIGEQFIPIIIKMLEEITPVVEAVAEWINENQDLTKKIIIAGLAVTALVTAIGTLGLILPSIIAGFALLLSPIGLVSVAIIALSGLALYLAKNWGYAKDGMLQIWQEIRAGFFESVNWIKSKTIDPLIKGFSAVLDIAEKVKNVISDIGGGAINKIKSIGGNIARTIGVDDAIISPNGNIITTNPKDYLIATQKPQDLLGGGSGGGTTININFPSATVIDRNNASKIVDIISQELRTKIRI